MKQRKQMDVYIYMLSANSQNVEFSLGCLMSYCEKKTTRLTGAFIDYCEPIQAQETRPSFINLLNIKKPSKFVLCCSTASDFTDLESFEKTIKEQGGKIHYYWDVIKERNYKEQERVRLKLG